MNKRTTTQDGKLEKLEQWRNLELDRAQAEHTRKQTIAAQQARAVDSVQSVVVASQNQMREQIAENQIISADSLTRIRHFTSLQLDELKQAQCALEESRVAAANAHAAMQRKFEDVAVIERLRKRRGAKADKEQLRQEQ